MIIVKLFLTLFTLSPHPSVPALKKHYELYKAANLSEAYWLLIVTQVMRIRQLPNLKLSGLMMINAAGVHAPQTGV